MLLNSPGDPCDFCDRKEADFGMAPGCEGCPVLNLSPADQAVWELYQDINRQFVYDFGALSLVFEIHGLKLSKPEAKRILRELCGIHDIVTEHGRKQGSNNP